MNEREVLADLIALAQSAGLAVQRVPRATVTEGGAPLASALCRVGDEWRIVLVASDSPRERIEVVAAALREHRGAWLEARFVPPALRRWLERD